MLRFHGSRDKETFELVGLQLAPRRAAGGAAARSCSRTSTLWCDGRRAAAAAYEEAGLGEVAALPVPSPARARRGTSTSCATRRPTSSPRRCKAAEIGSKAYYRVPTHRQPAMRPYAAGVELPATDELARTHLAIPMSPVLSREQAAEVTEAARAVSANRMR